ncbi:MAE_28990/MAE_18760 family HEPN-like nuclease [Limnohabitans sp.]|uniref:MAE_28990/MAE_18760 family HEPN-like nuclease n=1 Tax=Limnohabitans sp. TaxID=1907725 RepID=UPI0035B12D90
MARYTTAYSSFIQRIDEVEILRKSAAKKERKNAVAYSNEINALSRGAIVLLSSHLEAYVKELGELAIDSLILSNIDRSKIPETFFYHVSKSFIDEIKDTSDSKKLANKIFEFIVSDGSMWSKSGPFPQQPSSERFNRGFSNPAYEKIKAYFGRFGYQTYQSDISAKLQGNYLTVINMINHLVDVRNKIAHGDPSATKTPGEVLDIIKLIRVFCMVTDSNFAGWWGSNYCKLR